MKTLNFKVQQSVLDRINYYRATPESGRPTQADFFTSAALEKCERIRHQRSGGLELTMPNPNLDKITDADKAKVMDVLNNAIAELQKTSVPVAECLGELAEYLKFHFFEISDKQKKSFAAKLIVDLEVEADLDKPEGEE